MRISKSNYVAGVQCLKRLYWQVHQPGLAAEADASAFAIMEQGREVGPLARQLFPGGVEVSGFGLDKARLSIECGDHLLKKRGNHFVAVHAEGYRGNHTKDYDR
jgi:hypothetical protein